jgi:HAD superfamily hydrolase (TIGR01549 family)
MISALLFDLDGTLLDSDMDVFIPPYFRALAVKLSSVVPREPLLNALLASTQMVMRSKGVRQQTNHDVFWSDFLARLGRSYKDLQLLIDAFYRDDFDRLMHFTAAKPEARPCVQAAFDLGYTVVVATQPVFPLVAIEHRLEWGDVRDFPYALITSYDNMHTTKPDPAYYREICQMIGHQPQNCLMIGNDPDADVRASAAAGMHTFWLADQGQTPIPGLPAEYTGTLNDVQSLIQALAATRPPASPRAYA